MKPRLHTLITSTRPGRQGPAVARWFHAVAAEHGGFDASLVDLADFKLPVFDEPNHPSAQEYRHAHTRAWSDSVATADAFVFVTPEYNAGPPPSLLNALDYLYREWNCKPVAFVSYGGVSGGQRAVQMLKQIVTTLKMMPMAESPRVFRACPLITPQDACSSLQMLAIARAMAVLCASIRRLLVRCSGTPEKLSGSEAVVLPNFQQHVDADGRFAPKVPESQAAGQMLTELLRWSRAMASLR
jgi:NAD(P)H-dependent FMN reductase